MFVLAGCVAGPSGSDSASRAPSMTQTALGVVRIDTRGVVVDDRLDDRSWVTVDLATIEGGESKPATLDGAVAWTGEAAIHVRGNSSSDYAKKQYALETRDSEGEDLDVALFGMPEEEDWVLAAPYSDKTLMRNHLMFHWSRAIGRYAPRTHFVELYMEDGGDELGPEDYRGVYVVTEKIKRDNNRVNIEKMTHDDNDGSVVEGGYLIRRDWIEDRTLTTSVYGDELMLEYPKPENASEQQWSYIEGFLNEMEQALSRNDGSHTEWLDLESFADHMMMMELSRNVDAYVLSTYMHKSRTGRLTMGPIWDFNGSLGNADYFESYETDGWHYENPEFPADNPAGFEWYERLLAMPAFQQQLSDRWRMHRQGPWSDAALIADIDETAQLLGQAQARNFERWPVLGTYVWPNDAGAEERRSYADEVQYLKQWVTARTAWLDEQWLR